MDYAEFTLTPELIISCTRSQVGGASLACDLSGVKVLGVVLDVLVHEGVDKEVAVVIALQEEMQRQQQEATHTTGGVKGHSMHFFFSKVQQPVTSTLRWTS